MSLQPLIPYLIAILVATVAAMVWAAAGDHKLACALAAGLLAASLILASLRVNLPLLRGGGAIQADTPVHAARRNARLMALAYGWGAAAMLAVYGLSGLWWFHSWQYGSAMALVAASLIAYVHRVGDADSQLRSAGAMRALAALTVLQGLGAALGVALLLASGKPWHGRPDWVANQVFIAGGVTIVVLSAISVATHVRLTAR